MDYSGFKTPYISNKEIRERADKAREEFWGMEIPVDIEKILMKLKITIIPLPGLRSLSGFESFIFSDWQNVYVDNDAYFDDFKYRRVRFSLAHELGHLILHKELYESLKIARLEDYYKLYESLPNDQYGYFETQANNFAGYFLVPRDIVLREREKLIKDLKKKLEGSGHEDADLTDYIVNDLAEKFNVSNQPIMIALRN